MARIKIVYIGGGSTRAPGTLASLLNQGSNFSGSEVVLVDLDKERLDCVARISRKMAAVHEHDITITTTTDRRAALRGCDAVLSSFRPGGFEARVLDEQIPLKHGVIGQETQGPGGFFMALRSIHILKQIAREMKQLCPNAWLFNYTNPVNIVSEAITHHTDLRVVSLCEGPIIFPKHHLEWAGLDPQKLDVVMIGLNHACWSVQHRYDGQDLIPILKSAYERLKKNRKISPVHLRLLALSVEMESIPAEYFRYYYMHEQELAAAQNAPMTRAQYILTQIPDYWKHYQEQAMSETPKLDPSCSRGGINELELAIDVMDAIFNNRNEVWPVNSTNNGSIPDFPDDLVVEVPALVNRRGIFPLPQVAMPKHAVGLVKSLGEYQSLAAEAAWCGKRRDAIRALMSHPLVLSMEKAEKIYDEMAAAHRQYLPDRLLQN